ncbi:MAG: HNH endonuclease [Sedimentisphaerales bacterium]|nr:HNH endonuclease [Sedimentisphaerales bacterium]
MSKSKIEWTEIVKRFWSYVDKTQSCWLWKAGLFSNGYGQFRVRNKKIKAHRFAYEIANGKILPNIIVCHSCDNPKCVNPKHLFLSTHKGNALDREFKKRHPHTQTADLSGEKNPASKINPLIVHTIRKYRKKGHTYSQLVGGVEISFNIKLSKSQIANIVHRRCWKNVG